MEQYIDDRIKKYISNEHSDLILYLFTPSGYGKSVRLPTILSNSFRILMIEANELYANYFRLRTSEVTYMSTDTLWNTVIEKYDKNKCVLNFDYDLIIFDDYTDENIEMTTLIQLLMRCNFRNIMLQNSNVRPKLWNLEDIKIPFKSFHTDIRYFDTNYDNYDDRKMLKDISRLINDFNSSTIEGNFLIVLPKAFMVNNLYTLLQPIGTVYKFTHYDSLASLNTFIKDADIIETSRKIIIITDTLEPLLSIPRLGLILETGFESKVANTLTGGKRKIVVPITYERLNKYCSRLNIKFPGICFRMFTKDRIESKQQNIKTTDGMFWYQILQLRSKGLEDLIVDSQNASVILSFETLKTLDMCNDYKEPSCIFAHKSQLGIRNSLALFRSLKSKHILSIMILLCFIDNYDPYFYYFPTKLKNEIDTEFTIRLLKYKQDILLRFGGYSDIETFINVWNDYIDKVKDPWVTTEQTIKVITNYKWFILLKVIKNTLELLKSQYKVKIAASVDYKIDIDLDQFKKLLSETYQDKIISLDEEQNYYVDSKDMKHRLDQKFSLNLLGANLPKSVINLVDLTVKFEGGLKFVLLALDV